MCAATQATFLETDVNRRNGFEQINQFISVLSVHISFLIVAGVAAIEGSTSIDLQIPRLLGMTEGSTNDQ
jgi:hypothetical protein